VFSVVWPLAEENILISKCNFIASQFGIPTSFKVLNFILLLQCISLRFHGVSNHIVSLLLIR